MCYTPKLKYAALVTRKILFYKKAHPLVEGSIIDIADAMAVY